MPPSETTSSGEPAGDECLVFLHIPKAAGNTIKTILASRYPAEQVYRIDGNHIRASNAALARWPGDRLRQLRVVMGHMAFGVHQLLPQRCRYLTVLREPVSRLVSHYYYVRASPRHYLHHHVVGGDLSLVDYATSGLTTELDNGQVRMLAGLEDEPARLFSSTKVPPGTIPWGGCTAEHLQRAKDNLASHFEVVGLHERFDESLALMDRRFGWDLTSYQTMNVTPGRPPLEQIDPDQREAIRAVNALDVELHDFARGLLAAQLARAFPDGSVVVEQAGDRDA